MRSVFTITTPLPAHVTRETVIDMLHDHARMIELNPLVINHEQCKPPKNAAPDEFHCIWYEVTDRMSYLPGIKGSLKFNCCFNDLPIGLQTHVYAPMGLDIQERWSVGGNLPGEPREPRELGIDVPRDCLYLREDVNMNVSKVFTSFTKSKLNKAHKTLVERLLKKGEIIDDQNYQTALSNGSDTRSTSDSSSTYQQPMHSPHGSQRMSSNPYRVSTMSGISGYDPRGMPSPSIYPPPTEGQPQYAYQYQDPNRASMLGPPSGKSFISELPGSTPPVGNTSPPLAELYSPGRPPAGGMTHGSPPPNTDKKYS